MKKKNEMKMFTWKDRLGLDYHVFACSVKEAKEILREHYVEADLDKYLFNLNGYGVSGYKVQSMPRGFCNMNQAQTVWLDKVKGRK